jgi:hypothetical protein
MEDLNNRVTDGPWRSVRRSSGSRRRRRGSRRCRPTRTPPTWTGRRRSSRSTRPSRGSRAADREPAARRRAGEGREGRRRRRDERQERAAAAHRRAAAGRGRAAGGRGRGDGGVGAAARGRRVRGERAAWCRGRGPGGREQQRQSAEAITSAQQGVINAQRSLQQAAVSAGNAGGASMATLQSKLAALSPAGPGVRHLHHGHPQASVRRPVAGRADRVPARPRGGLKALQPLLPSIAGSWVTSRR